MNLKPMQIIQMKGKNIIEKYISNKLGELFNQTYH